MHAVAASCWHAPRHTKRTGLRGKAGPTRKGDVKQRLELDGQVVVDALEELLHLGGRRLARVRAGAGVGDGVDGDLRSLLEELLLVDDRLVGLDAALAVVLDALRDVDLVVEVADHLDEGGNQLVLGLAGTANFLTLSSLVRLSAKVGIMHWLRV